MSTRGFYVFKNEHESHNVYKHSDNYPESEHGGFAAIGRAGKLAWELPRFEPDEFGAAFIAANKGGSGNLRLCASGDWKDVASDDIEYLYVVDGKTVVCHAVSCQWGKSEWTMEQVYSKPLKLVIEGWYPKRRAA